MKGLAIAAGVVVFGFLVWAVLSMARPAGVRGVIVEKRFQTQPETQITFGRGGLRAKEFPGVYTLRVKHPQTGRIYDVQVNAQTYGERKEGDAFYFTAAP